MDQEPFQQKQKQTSSKITSLQTTFSSKKKNRQNKADADFYSLYTMQF